MNRLQKKCLIASSGIHVLLGVIVLIGPGFMSSNTTLENLPEINFVPSLLVDQALVGGGSPMAKPPPVVTPAPPAPPAAPPEPKPEPKPRELDPVVEPVKDQKPEPAPVEPQETRKRTPEIPLTLKTRPKTTSPTTSKPNQDAQAQERQRAEERQRVARQFADAAKNIRKGTGSATTIEDVEFGPGGGGPAYASYAAWIQTVYQNAWVPPEDSTLESAVAYASITIGRDGSIVSATLVTRSGDTSVDSSVRRTLDGVTTIGRPFPEGVKDKERTYRLRFDLKAKRGQV
jgi:hypothetical protein